jgi:hypothetical protein
MAVFGMEKNGHVFRHSAQTDQFLQRLAESGVQGILEQLLDAKPTPGGNACKEISTAANA